MRRFSYTLTVLAIGALFVGCSSATDKALDDFESSVEKIIEASKGRSKEELMKDDKIKDLQADTKKYYEKVEALKDDFTPDQKARLLDIVQRVQDTEKSMDAK